MTDPAAAAFAVRAGIVRDFARSALFERTFQDGMALVEDTAAYLDGAGRQESRLLPKSAALAYASESMRLTTQLMQTASWLLVQRAVREGDMAPVEACEARYRIDARADHATDDVSASAKLPAGLLALTERARLPHARINHLDRRMYCAVRADDTAHPVLAQMDRVRAAFGGPV